MGDLSLTEALDLLDSQLRRKPERVEISNRRESSRETSTKFRGVSSPSIDGHVLRLSVSNLLHSSRESSRSGRKGAGHVESRGGGKKKADRELHCWRKKSASAKRERGNDGLNKKDMILKFIRMRHSYSMVSNERGFKTLTFIISCVDKFFTDESFASLFASLRVTLEKPRCGVLSTGNRGGISNRSTI